MHILRFQTKKPYDAVPRALDFARKSEFVLEQIVVNSDANQVHYVQLIFKQKTLEAFQTFVERMRNFPDAYDLSNVDMATSSDLKCEAVL